VRSAILRILDPLVQWMLEAGVGVGDFLTLVKVAYVRAARRQGEHSYGEARRPNASRIAVVTGLTRAQVASILSADALEPGHDRGRQRAERVLSGWWNDPAFQNAAGEPAALPIRRGRRSFARLVERYSGERWRVATILEELLRVRAICRLDDGRVQALSRTYATVRWDPEGVEAFGMQLSEHCTTLLHNLNFPGHPRYVCRVLNARLNPHYGPMLIRDIERQAQVLADSVDAALNDPQQTLSGKDADAKTMTLGLSLYVFEGATSVRIPRSEESVGPRQGRSRSRKKRER
jgi:uncharacterized protein DUF6502